MEDGNEAMISHTDAVPYAAYPPLPPLSQDSNLLVMLETRTAAIHQGGQG